MLYACCLVHLFSRRYHFGNFTPSQVLHGPKTPLCLLWDCIGLAASCYLAWQSVQYLSPPLRVALVVITVATSHYMAPLFCSTPFQQLSLCVTILFESVVWSVVALFSLGSLSYLPHLCARFGFGCIQHLLVYDHSEVIIF